MPILGIIASAINLASSLLKTVIFGVTSGSIFKSTDGTTFSSSKTVSVAEDWNKITTFSTTINSIKYGNSAWIAGGSGGLLLTSTDLSTWTTRTSNFGEDSNSIRTSASATSSIWVIGGAYGKIRRSTDLSSWSTVTSTFGTSEILAMDYGNGLFVAVGGYGKIRTSSDGSTWTTRTSNIASAFMYAVKYANNIWVAAGNYGTIRKSTDATTWTTATSNFDGSFRGLAYGNGTWVAVGYSSTIRTSTDAVTWTTRTLGYNATIDGVVFAEENFVALTNSDIPYARSTDGITWTSISSGTAREAGRSITYAESTFVVPTSGGITVASGQKVNNLLGLSFVSTPLNIFGTFWTKRTSTLTSNLTSIAYGNGTWLLSGYGTTDLYMSKSTDLVTWNTVTSNFGENRVNAVEYNSGLWVAGGPYGQMRTSTDLVTWTTVNPQITGTIQKIVYGENKWVALGSDSNILSYSTNGTSWVTSSHNGGSVQGLAYGNGKWVISGSNGQIRNSTDAITWVTATANAGTNYLLRVAYGNGAWVATGNNIIRRSTDAVTWSTINSPLLGTNGFRGLTYTPSGFVATNTQGDVLLSTDGTTWGVDFLTPAKAGATFARYGNNTVVAGGYGNSLSSSMVNSTENLWLAGTNAGGLLGSTDLISWGQKYTGFGGPINSINYGGETSQPIGNIWTKAPRFSYPTNNIQALKYDNNVFVSGNYHGVIYSSTDAITWTSRYAPAANLLDYAFGIRGIGYGNSVWLALGYYGYLRKSTDAITWTSITRASTSRLSDLVYGNSIWAIAGYNGLIHTSTNDGTTWTTRTSNTTRQINKITYANNTWVVGGNTGYLGKSTDSITWTTVSIPFTSTVYGIAYGNGKWVISGNNGFLSNSTDLTTWTTVSSGTSQAIYSVRNINNIFYAAAPNTVLQSTDGTTWTSSFSGVAGQQEIDGTSSRIAVGGEGSSYSIPITNDFKSFTLASTTGAIKNSTDFISWSNSSTTVPADFFGSSVYGNTLTSSSAVGAIDIVGQKIVAGANGAFVSSNSASQNLNSSTLEYKKIGFDWNAVGGTDIVPYYNFISYENNQFIRTNNTNSASKSTDGITWTTISIPFNDLSGITYGNGTYVATNNVGGLFTSTDLSTWTTRTSTFGSSTIFRARYANGIWVAVGAGGTIRTSSDGATWTTRTSNTTEVFYEVNYVNSNWVALGGIICRSSDASTWTSANSPFSAGYPIRISYGAGYYLMGKYGNQSPSNEFMLARSTNLTAWTTYALPVAYGYPKITDIVYANSVFMISEENNLYSSTDAATFTPVPTTGNPAPYLSTGLAFGNNTYVIQMAYYNQNWYSKNTTAFSSITQLDKTTDSTKALVISNGALYDSSNGKDYSSVDLSWTKLSVGSSQEFTSVGLSGSTSIAGSSAGVIYVSTDDVSWTSTNVNSGQIYSINSANGKTVAVGANSLLVVSTDNLSWTSIATGFTGSIRDVNYSNSLWTIAGDNGQVYSSTDATTWTSRDPSFGTTTVYSSTVNAATYSNSIWTAVGYKTLVSSTDGVAWINIDNDLPTNATFQAIKYANSTYVVGGDSAAIFKSTNRTTWTTISGLNLDGAQIYGIDNDGTQWVVATNSGTIRTSTDLITWVSRTSPVDSFKDLHYGNGLWVAAGYKNSYYGVITSTDAITWTTRNTNVTSYVWKVRSGGGVFVATGRDAQIRRSTDGTTWATVTSNLTEVDIFYLGHGNGQWVAGVYGAPVTLRRSTDGITWTTVTSPGGSSTKSINYGNRWVINASGTPSFLSSTDAVTWTSSTFSYIQKRQIDSITYGNSTWVISGQIRTTRSSTDLITWTTVTPAIYNSNVKTVFANGIWVASSYNEVSRSTDLVTWTTSLTAQATPIVLSTYNNIFRMDTGDYAKTSTNGTTWTTLTQGSFSATVNDAVQNEQKLLLATTSTATDTGLRKSISQQTSAIIANYYANGVLAADNGLLFTYDSGSASWIAVYTAISDNLNKVTFDGTNYVVLGDNAVYYSNNATVWTTSTTGVTNSTITDISI